MLSRFQVPLTTVCFQNRWPCCSITNINQRWSGLLVKFSGSYHRSLWIFHCGGNKRQHASDYRFVCLWTRRHLQGMYPVREAIQAPFICRCESSHTLIILSGGKETFSFLPVACSPDSSLCFLTLRSCFTLNEPILIRKALEILYSRGNFFNNI